MYNYSTQSAPFLQSYGSRAAGSGPVETVFLLAATLLVIALTVLSVVVIIRILNGRPFIAGAHPEKHPVPKPNETARLLNILDERFARGEISPADYQKVRQSILGRDATTPPQPLM